MLVALDKFAAITQPAWLTVSTQIGETLGAIERVGRLCAFLAA